MGKIIPFPGNEITPENVFSLEVNDIPEDKLEDILAQIEDIYSDLEQEEPEDTESEEYYEWSEMLEALDDLMDEIQERIDEMDD